MSIKRISVLLLITVCCAVVSAAVLESSSASYRFDDSTGNISSIDRKSDKKTVVHTVSNRYFLLAKSGDRKASDRNDTVSAVKKGKNWITYYCVNPRLPGFAIEKHYSIVNDGLRRKLTFVNSAGEIKFLQVFTDSRFAGDFRQSSYYFGAGYLGPFIPAPKVKQATRVESFVQSSKGMVLINPDKKRGSFANFRVKLNDTVVFPWWQSTIGSYREKSDRLYYLPDGWRMALGTFDLAAKTGKFTYTDQLVFFNGDLFDFFEKVYARDPDFAAAYAQIPDGSPAVQDFMCEINWGFEPYLNYFTRLNKEGNIICKTMICADWADYRWQDGFNSQTGGFITAGEIQKFIDGIKAVSPRIYPGFHTITVSGTTHSPIFKEHPEYFRKYDRVGDLETHFPGLVANYQTMINRPEVRKYIVDSVCSMAESTGIGFIYQDEAQHQNTINWQTMELIRDDHSILVWDAIRRRGLKHGKIIHFNGSGNPFADINYMECPARMLVPSAWREFAGVGLGLEMVSKMRPNTRISLLYMNNISDYFGRCLAHGWLVCLGDVARNNPGVLTLIRSVYELGKTLPQRADYTPDWKRDPRCSWESYSVRRLNSNDTVISFINRTGKVSDLPMSVDLKSLGYPAETRLNVWAYRTIYPQGDMLKYILSDDEIRENWSKYRWSGLFSAVPELIYSGNAGNFTHTFPRVGVNDLVQYVITPGAAVIHSFDDQPGTYYFTRCRGVDINGKKVISSRKKAAVMLADKYFTFSDIKVDGKKVPSIPADVSGLLCQIIEVPAGEHTIEYTPVPRGQMESCAAPQVSAADGKITIANAGEELYALVRSGRTVLTGKSPLQLPERYFNGKYIVRRAGNSSRAAAAVTLNRGKNSEVVFKPYPYIPPKAEFQSVNMVKDGVKILRSAVYKSGHRELRNIQQDLPPVIVKADAANLALTAGTTRRHDTLDINHYAGFELSGARSVQLKLTHNFARAKSFFKDGSHVWHGGENSKIDFSGIVVDYRVNGKYAKRVIFSWGIGTRYLQNRHPSWGSGKVQDGYIRLPDMLDKPEHIFSLDLTKYAPENWDGTVFFAAGNNHILADRMFTLSITGFNNSAAGNFISGQDMSARGRTKFMPEPVYLPKLKSIPVFPADEKEFAKWAKISVLQPYGETEELTQQSAGYFAYDQKNLYVALFAHEKARPLRAKSGIPYQNDCIDLFIEGKDGKLSQMCVDAKGRHIALPEGSFAGAKTSVQPLKTGGYAVFMTVPWSNAAVKEAVPGLSMRINFCRSRVGKGGDRGAWGPVRSGSGLGFRDVEKYGKIVIGFPVSGMGRYDEVTI